MDYTLFLDRLGEYGLDDLELYIQVMDKNEIYFDHNNKVTYNKVRSNGVGIRIFKNSKTSFVYTSLNIDAMDRAIRIAVSNISNQQKQNNCELPASTEKEEFR
ncbi:MAG: hypothetical protein KAX49_14790 [Halanaerobiales bacterium]|nr:hypothetical protein [Halanaerobiales bacterium]